MRKGIAGGRSGQACVLDVVAVITGLTLIFRRNVIVVVPTWVIILIINVMNGLKFSIAR